MVARNRRYSMRTFDKVRKRSAVWWIIEVAVTWPFLSVAVAILGWAVAAAFALGFWLVHLLPVLVTPWGGLIAAAVFLVAVGCFRASCAAWLAWHLGRRAGAPRVVWVGFPVAN